MDAEHRQTMLVNSYLFQRPKKPSTEDLMGSCFHWARAFVLA